jgi:hypothetical protein
MCKLTSKYGFGAHATRNALHEVFSFGPFRTPFVAGPECSEAQFLTAWRQARHPHFFERPGPSCTPSSHTATKCISWRKQSCRTALPTALIVCTTVHCSLSPQSCGTHHKHAASLTSFAEPAQLNVIPWSSKKSTFLGRHCQARRREFCVHENVAWAVGTAKGAA